MASAVTQAPYITATANSTLSDDNPGIGSCFVFTTQNGAPTTTYTSIVGNYTSIAGNATYTSIIGNYTTIAGNATSSSIIGNYTTIAGNATFSSAIGNYTSIAGNATYTSIEASTYTANPTYTSIEGNATDITVSATSFISATVTATTLLPSQTITVTVYNTSSGALITEYPAGLPTGLPICGGANSTDKKDKQISDITSGASSNVNLKGYALGMVMVTALGIAASLL